MNHPFRIRIGKNIDANITKHANLQRSYWIDGDNIIRKAGDRWENIDFNRVTNEQIKLQSTQYLMKYL